MRSIFFVLFHLIVGDPGFLDVDAASYTCDVPDEWLFQSNDTISTQSFFPGTKWPGGIVKYELHSSLTPEDLVEVQKSFDEYHRKTCIRFQPRSPGEAAYTSIENDPGVCGLGNYCRTGGYQFARFGGGCRDAVTMIHELGHNLCLGHEMNRADRDSFVKFDGCSSFPGRDDSFIGSGLFYDYASQMHYQCNWCSGGWPTMNGVPGCGSDITPGLSVLDADKINAFYSCGGCYSHRWRNVNALSAQDKLNMRAYGTDLDNAPLYICRGYVNGQIHPGKYRMNDYCYIPYGGSENAVSEAEVLTNPTGNGGTYSLRKMPSSIPSNAIPAGLENGKTLYPAICALNVNGRIINTPGKVVQGNPSTALVPFDGQELTCTDFSFLTCN